MPRVTLAPYIVRIHKRRQPRTFERIDAFDGHTSLYSVFESVVRNLSEQEASVDDEHERALTLRSFDKSDEVRRIWGTTRGGAYGYESTLYDVRTGNESQRSRDQAELIPLYFVADLGGERDFGIVLFQKFGNHGIVGHFQTLLQEHFGEHYPQYLLTLRHIAPESILDEIVTGGRVQAVHFVKFAVPPDVIDGLAGAGLEQLPGSVDIRVKVRGGMPQVRSRVLQWFRREDRGPVRGLIELGGEVSDFDYDTIKVELGASGNTKLVDLERLGRLRANFNIDGEVDKDAGGHPTRESIHQVARSYLNQVLETFSPGG